jgi:uncharacterized membrane protein YjgN (DUF898 family)
VNTSAARLRYHGMGGSLLGLVVVNALLTIVTLGIYSFWAKNRVRQFHYSHTELDGDRFAYHGTGGELLAGTLKAIGVILLIAIAYAFIVAILAVGDQAMQAVGVVAFYAAFTLLSIVAVHGARRYRMSRSSWRGIRFSYRGDLGDFMRMMLRGIGLSVVTLLFYTPYFQNQRRAFLVNSAHFGSEPFLYDADGRDLFREFVQAVLLTVPTLGLYWIWYVAFKHRYFWNNTFMRGARFSSTVTGTALFELHLINVFLVLFTLGIGTPWAITRTMEFWCDNLALEGTVDWATIQQRAQTADSVGDALAEGFDVDVGIG